MLAFISCAKTMASRSTLQVPQMTNPRFTDEALRHALSLARYSASELGGMLRVNAKIAAENYIRYQDFCSEDNLLVPAIGAYTGAVFKRIAPKDFTPDDFLFAQEHLRITSFLYGLLRPLDGIRPYRLEGDVRLPENGGAFIDRCIYRGCQAAGWGVAQSGQCGDERLVRLEADGTGSAGDNA